MFICIIYTCIKYFLDRFSATNATHLYSMILTEDRYLESWGLSDRPTMEHVWDSFIILSLLKDHKMQGTYLEVPHGGDQCVRFKAAMEERNKRIILQEQPEAVQHVCKNCMHVFKMDDGKFRMYILSSWLLTATKSNGAVFRCTN